MKHIFAIIITVLLFLPLSCATKEASMNNRGVGYLNKGEFDKAIEDFNKAIAINPNYAKAYYNRGVIYYKKWLDEKAISDFRKACDK